MRQKFIAGNWKMFTNGASGAALAKGLVDGIAGQTKVRVAVCPPYPYLSLIGNVVKGSWWNSAPRTAPTRSRAP